MKALLLVAHGSRRHASNDEVHALAELLKSRCQTDYSLVKAAFLELAEPSIPQGIQQCIDAGATAITILPYFLNSGRHVTEDIPEEIAKGREYAPEVEIQLMPHIGAANGMIALLVDAAQA